MIKITKHRIRMFLGYVMIMSFLAIVFQVDFFSQVAFQYNNWYIAMIMLLGWYWHMWIPSVVLIIMTYLLLTKVYKENKDD